MRPLRSVLVSTALACALSGCQFASGLDKLHAPQGVSVAGESASTEEPEAGASSPIAGAGAGAPKAQPGGTGGARSGTQEQGGSGGMGRARVADGGRTAPELPAPGGAGASQHVAAGSGGASGAAAGSGDMPSEPDNGDTSNEAGSGSSAPVCTAAPSGGAACNPAPQCGCAAAENCAYYGGHLACVPVGSVQPNYACNNASECMLGYQCDYGACLRLCDQSHPDCDRNAMCRPHVDEASKNKVPGVFTCDSNCNLAQPERENEMFHGCGPGLTCSLAANGSTCAKRTGVGGTHGQLCTVLGCQPGYNCRSDGICAKWCTSSSDCPDGFSCDKQWSARVASTEFGFCAPTCPHPAGAACGTTPQCGCASDQSCDTIVNFDSKWTNACRAAGNVGAYGYCSNNDACAKGMSCAGGLCRPFCSAKGEDCGERYTKCSAVTDSLSTMQPLPEVPGDFVCVRPCDPANITQAHGIYEPCASGQTCEPMEDARSYCRPIKKSGTTGDSCASADDCASKYTCTTPSYVCAQICRLNGFDCLRGVCRSFNPRTFAGDVEWGSCDTSTVSN